MFTPLMLIADAKDVSSFADAELPQRRCRADGCAATAAKRLRHEVHVRQRSAMRAEALMQPLLIRLDTLRCAMRAAIR